MTITTTPAEATETDATDVEYHQDFFNWTQRQAELLRTGRLDQLDIENLIDEVESLGKRDRRELYSRATVLIAHLLKWQCQAEWRSRSWRSTIIEQRHQIQPVLADSPSLRPTLRDEIATLYRHAVRQAVIETGLSESAFPTDCPYTADDLLSDT